MPGPTPGQTKSAGWEVGVRRTLRVSADRAWELIATPPGLGVWRKRRAKPHTSSTPASVVIERLMSTASHSFPDSIMA